MPDGTTFKRCSCRTDTGALLGRSCPRLRRPDGSWSRHHGRWYYQLELPAHLDGRRRGPLRRGGFDTRTDAEAELGRARDLLGLTDDPAAAAQLADTLTREVKESGRLPDVELLRRRIRTGQDLSEKITIADWLERWLPAKKTLRASTRHSYAGHIRLYLIPQLGHLLLDRLRVADVAAMFDTIDELNDTLAEARASTNPAVRAAVRGRRPVGAATKQRIRATLRAALADAVRQRLIDLNVAALVQLPAGKRPKALVWTDARVTAWRADHQAALAAARATGRRVDVVAVYLAVPRPSPVMVWTPAQTGQFLDYAHTHPRYPLFRLIAYRGLRRGEGCGLRWPDLDLPARVATVRWQIVQLGWDTIQGPPKSDAGDRQVALDADTVKVMRRHHAAQARARLAAADAWTDTGFVFTGPDGAPIHPATVTDQFHQLACQAGLPPIRLHDLRHGAATLLLAAGHDLKIVQDTLGLSSITIAADTYTSVLPELARQAAEDAAALIPRRTATAARAR